MGVAFVSEAGVKLPCDGCMPFEHGDKFKGNTPESLACLLLGSILSGNPIAPPRCPECKGHVLSLLTRAELILARDLRVEIFARKSIHVIYI